MDKYEKLYNEALEVMRQWIAPCHTPEQLEAMKKSVFPELAESEDERIINQLITLVDSTGEVLLIPTNKEELIAWLKKQKENPKSADSIPSDCVSDAKCEDKSPKHSDSDGTDIRDTPAYWKGWDDAIKQKEQKHPNGCFTCDEYKKGYEEGRRNGFTAGYNKAMKEVEQKEQKPWKVGANAYFTPEQKPVEWSEEDERNFYWISTTIQERHLTPEYTEQVHKILTWLKSLRPSWKPSEEQMGSLRDTIVQTKGYSYSMYLPELYEQLKKLM